MKMKNTLAISLLAGVMFAGPARAGIPVVDVAGNLQNMMNHIEDALSFAAQLTQLENQLAQARQTYNSLNGIRNMGQLLNNPMAREYLPKSVGDVYRLGTSVADRRFDGVSGNVRAIKQASAILKSEDFKNPNGAAAKMTDKAQSRLAAMQATAESGYNEAGQRFEKLQALVDKVDAAGDAKAVADLNARIAAEQVMMQNEQVKLSQMKQMQEAQELAAQQQAREVVGQLGGGNIVLVSQY